MDKLKMSVNVICSLVLCLVILFSSGGCEPLRKKFIRQKKVEKKIEDAPILTPIDYVPKNTSPKERYAHHYSLLRVWYKELHEEMTERKFPSDKRQQSLLGEMIAQLNEMKKWVVVEKQDEITPFITQLQKIQEELEQSSFFGNNVPLATRIDRIEKKIRRNFSPKVMEKYFIQ